MTRVHLLFSQARPTTRTSSATVEIPISPTVAWCGGAVDPLGVGRVVGLCPG